MKRIAFRGPALSTLFFPVAILFAAMGGPAGCAPAAKPPVAAAVSLTDRIVEAACGECQFSMPGESCDLAIRIDGTCYFVDGSGIDDHGDAHGSDGLCNCCRPAKVSGTLVDGRFRATKFELLPVER